jgi:alpha-1,6-mannosyltransferase
MRKKSRQSLLFCDLTQSWSEKGGGVRTYLLRKRQHIIDHTPDRHLLIIPGAEDGVTEEGRAITVTIKSPRVPGSPNYRLLLRNRAVRQALDRFRPDLVECQDAYNLPWAAIRWRKRNPGAALTAVYMTDFPTVYVDRPLTKVMGRALAGGFARLSYSYCARLYRHFDRLFALSEHGGAATLRGLGLKNVDVIGLGADVDDLGPQHRDLALRRSLGLADDQPLIIYVGRLDSEKRPDVVVEAFRNLPESLGAQLVLIGDGPFRADFDKLGDPRIHLLGFVNDRAALARWLASADIYASGMADETFGVSIVEAQASGLPVVGVAAGAMLDRVTEETGRLGPVGDATAMTSNILDVWNGDRARMAAAAIETAEQFRWSALMDRLFGDLYPAVMAGAAERSRSATN